MDGIQALPLFLAAAEELNFANAARRLGLSPSAASKAIARLETRLGVGLFHRTTRRVTLTTEGELLLERANLIRNEWREAEALLAETKTEPRGRLRVALPAIGHRLIGPHLATFAQQYPHVQLDLDLDDRIVDLVADKVDVAIRSGAQSDSAHRSRRLGSFRFLLCASPGYLARRGRPETLRALRDRARIYFRHPRTERIQPWRLSPDEELTAIESACTFTNMEAVLLAACSGLGIAQLPDFLAAPALDAGELATVLDDHAVSDTFWLVWPQSAHRSPKVRAFIDFSVAHLLKPPPQPLTAGLKVPI